MLKFGLLSLFTACLLFALSRQIAKTYVWTPVNVPLAFDTEHTVSTTFTADRKGSYYVQIDMERKMPLDQLDNVLDALQQGKTNAKNVPTIAWSVRSSGKVVELGEYTGMYSGKNVGCTVGTIEAVPSQVFVIEAHVTKSVPALQILNPHLKVEVASPEFTPYYIKSALVGYLAVFVFLVGLVVTIIGLFNKKQPKADRISDERM